MSGVKNLDDPKLIAYYQTLGVKNTENVNRPITRAEFLKLVLIAAGVSLDTHDLSSTGNESYSTIYSDLDQSSWYIPYFDYAVSHGIIE